MQILGVPSFFFTTTTGPNNLTFFYYSISYILELESLKFFAAQKANIWAAVNLFLVLKRHFQFHVRDLRLLWFMGSWSFHFGPSEV